jgi:hypothetical protein
LPGPEIQLNLGRTLADSQKREHTLLWLEEVMPSIQQIVESRPEEVNGKFQRPRTEDQLSQAVEALDLSFDPD